MSSSILVIIVGLIVLIAIILFIIFIKNRKKVEEKPMSILDIENIGVSENNQEFSYGYEKEPTIVMSPVDVNKDLQDLNSDKKDKNKSGN